jgi:alpha-tubulin suppressor-like RCC1 family protein
MWLSPCSGTAPCGPGGTARSEILAPGRVPTPDSPTNFPGVRSPAAVLDLTNVRAIAAGTYATYALGADGAVWSWGYGVYGQLGDGSYQSSDVPVPAIRLHDVVAIAAGGSSACLSKPTVAYGQGYGGYGQLGDGGSASSDVPVRVRGLVPSG